MQTDKLAAYLGLARRAGKLTIGVQAAECLKKGVYLLVADENVAKNSRKAIEKLQARFGCPLLFVPSLGEIVHRDGCVLAAVREENLAKAAINAHRGGTEQVS